MMKLLEMVFCLVMHRTGFGVCDDLMSKLAVQRVEVWVFGIHQLEKITPQVCHWLS